MELLAIFGQFSQSYVCQIFLQIQEIRGAVQKIKVLLK